jgi:hypothetical protein
MSTQAGAGGAEGARAGGQCAKDSATARDSFGALKLCERHPVNGYTFLASYYATCIGTYSVLGAKPILGCISRFGRFTVTPRDYLRDLISDISFEIIREI